MTQEKHFGFFYKFSITTIQLVYVNILWIGLTLLGLGIFGIFPATVTVFAVVRQIVKGEIPHSITKESWKIYKQEFVKANMLGLFHSLIALILIVDVIYFGSPTSIFTLILFYIFRIVLFIYILFSLFLFVIYAHFENNWWNYYKDVLYIMILKPMAIIAVFFATVCIVIFLRVLPGFIPFFVPTGIAYILTMIIQPTFHKIDGELE